MVDTSAAPRRTRRSPEEVRELLVEAATELFRAQGYQGTTTKEIAARAGVGEPVLFRHFGSKAGLFKDAALHPFTDWVDRWTRDWESRPPLANDPETVTRTFVKGIYGVIQTHRELFLILASAQGLGADPALAEVAREVGDALADALLAMRRVLVGHGDARQYAHLDAPVTVAAAVGAVISLALLGDWLFPAAERRPGKSRQIDELTQLLMHGIAHRDQ